jgi:protein involved in polysaccharide export with SLBB domain
MEKLTTAFKVYLKDPRVNIMVTQTRVADTLVYVVGQVRSPGSYDMRRGWTVAEVITQAGGVTDKAALTKAMVIRRGSTASIPVDLDKLIRKGDMTANVPVEGGDIILVPEFLNRVLVTGGVRTIGAFDLKEGGRVLDAIVAAGGPNDKGMLNQVAITRQVGEKRILLATVDVNKIMRAGDQSQNILLQHADVIYVPERGFRLTDVLTWLSGLQLVRSVFGF